MTIANLAATIFLAGAFCFFEQCVRALRSGVVRADFGYEFARGSVPMLFWLLVGMNALVSGVAATSAYWVLTSNAS